MTTAVVARFGRSLPSARVLYILLLWSATFSPIPMFGNPEVVRSSLAAAALVVLFIPASTRVTLALAVALLAISVAAAGARPHAGVLGDIEYLFGATWPRGWSDVSRTAGLVLLGAVCGRARKAQGL